MTIVVGFTMSTPAMVPISELTVALVAGSISRSMVTLTASAVNGSPLWKVTPSRSVNCQPLPSGRMPQFVARAGVNWPLGVARRQPVEDVGDEDLGVAPYGQVRIEGVGFGGERDRDARALAHHACRRRSKRHRRRQRRQRDPRGTRRCYLTNRVAPRDPLAKEAIERTHQRTPTHNPVPPSGPAFVDALVTFSGVRVFRPATRSRRAGSLLRRSRCGTVASRRSSARGAGCRRTSA